VSDLHVEGLRRAFGRHGEVVAVDDVSFDVVPGEMLVLVGPSGCGKTTTLRCVAGLEAPDAGVIRFGDRTIFDAGRKVAVPVHRRDIGLVFQNYALWPHLSGWDNIAFPLKARWVGRGERRARVRAIAEVVDLDQRLLDKRPGQLSGGQQQRVALARALVAEPAVVLFDEPLSNLDAALREQLRSELRRLHEQVGFTGVYVTHDLAEAMLLGDRVAAMADGAIVQLGPPGELFEHPATARIARMMGYRRLCLATSREGRWTAGDCLLSGPAGGTRPGQAYEVLARPGQVTAREPGAGGPGGPEYRVSGGTVTGIGYLGGEQELTVGFSGRALRLTAPPGHDLQVGSPVELAVPAGHARIYEAATHANANANVTNDREETSNAVPSA